MANVEAVKPAAQGARYGQVFAAGPFRALFGGTVLTIVATSLQMLGLSVLVYLATGSAWLSAVAYGAGFLPQMALRGFQSARTCSQEGIPTAGTKMLEIIAKGNTRMDNCAAVCSLPMIRPRYMPSQVAANWKATKQSDSFQDWCQAVADPPSDGAAAPGLRISCS
jgi:hypothetical protein